MTVDDNRPFAVYKASGVEIDLNKLIHDLIVTEDTGPEWWHPSKYISNRPAEIIATHQERDDVNQEYLIIANKDNVSRTGLLVVKLLSERVPDAVKRKPSMLGDEILSLSIQNTDWKDDVLCTALPPLIPLRAFAIFAGPSLHQNGTMARILETVDGGFGGRHADTVSVLSEWESLQSEDPGCILRYFEERRDEKDWDERYFLLCTGEAWAEAKVELVSAKTGKSWLWLCEIAGEVLKWLAIGMVSREELDEPPQMLLALMLGSKCL